MISIHGSRLTAVKSDLENTNMQTKGGGRTNLNYFSTLNRNTKWNHINTSNRERDVLLYLVTGESLNPRTRYKTKDQDLASVARVSNASELGQWKELTSWMEQAPSFEIR